MSQHAIIEANRCLKCKKPLCVEGCPVRTDIPGMAQMILDNDILNAGKILFENNPLSVICALICPHENQCEGHCILNRKNQPIHISSMEHYISDNYLTRMSYNVENKKNQEVAIVGSGPAGITLSYLLTLKGYNVTMFDNHDRIGGVLRYGIPEFRLPKSIIDRIKEKLCSMGVVIRPNTLIGPNLTLEDLFSDGYEAIFVGTGVWKPRRLNIPGETLGNVHFAIDYLKNPSVYKLGDKVAIIGAGNVAMDVARTALRQGSINVKIVSRGGEEQMPALKEEIRYARLDGVLFEYYKSPKALTKDGIIYHDVIKKSDEDGKEMNFIDEEKEALLEADAIIVAVSQGPQANIVSTAKGISIGRTGLVATDECGRTTREGVFAGGDVVSGAKTVVEAVRYAKLAAEAMDAYMSREK